MKRALHTTIAIVFAAAPGAAFAQASASAHTGGPAASVSVHAGGGHVSAQARSSADSGSEAPTTAQDAPQGAQGGDRGSSYAGPGNSVDVRSADGSASASAWVSGDDGVVAGAGSPGSSVRVSPPPRSNGSGQRGR